MERPPLPRPLLTLVWPNPRRDKSHLWIVRSWRVNGHYQLEHRIRFVNTAKAALSVNYGMDVSGWVDPNAEGPSMFAMQMQPWTPACLVDSEIEEESSTDLADEDDNRRHRESSA